MTTQTIDCGRSFIHAVNQIVRRLAEYWAVDLWEVRCWADLPITLAVIFWDGLSSI